MKEGTDIDFDVIARWEAMGLLGNLPLWEKEELAIIYDNMVKIILADKTIKSLPNDVNDLLNTVNFPIVRRLYRRVGPFFDIETMLAKLLDEIDGNLSYLKKEATPEDNPVVSFCVNFADNYEDEKTLSKQITKEEYTERVDVILQTLRDILLNDNMVVNAEKEKSGWSLNLSENKKTFNYTKFWNQKMGARFLSQSLSDLNKKA